MPLKRPIRRAQIISPFGIGAMVPFPGDESLMPAGLDAWPRAAEECPPDSGWKIVEERLQARLRVTHFRQPPDYREPGESYAPESRIACFRFPRWHYCPHCGGMEFIPLGAPKQEKCKGREYPQQSCHTRPEKRRPWLIPVRFVSICDVGHIEDFPFIEWVHRQSPAQPDCRLRLRAGRSSAGLAGITIKCSCGQSRTMADAFRWDDQQNSGALSQIKCSCQGLRPWLGETAPDRRGGGQVSPTVQACGLPLRVVQRGASNVYFPHVVSAIYLPLWAEQTDRRIIEALEDPVVWNLLTQGLVDAQIDPVRTQVVAGMRHLDTEKLLGAARRKLEGRPAEAGTSDALADEEQFRHGEYEALAQVRGDARAELFITAADPGDYGSSVGDYFARVRLVQKLRETRALAGFTRWIPPDGDLRSPRLQRVRLNQQLDWLPAVKVYGEGIFLELDTGLLTFWLAAQPKAVARVADLEQKYNAARTRRLLPPRAVTPKFVLLHTLAHVLINQLSFDCGYGSASLRERIYCDLKDSSRPMSGVLIYTASGDAEGSMGGLVRQGKPGRLEGSLVRAIKRAAWCSSDPVCIESPGQGSDNSNLAACHGCCLLPETSCEEGNRLLDRALLVGTPSQPSLGLFCDLL